MSHCVDGSEERVCTSNIPPPAPPPSPPPLPLLPYHSPSSPPPALLPLGLKAEAAGGAEGTMIGVEEFWIYKKGKRRGEGGVGIQSITEYTG